MTQPVMNDVERLLPEKNATKLISKIQHLLLKGSLKLGNLDLT